MDDARRPPVGVIGLGRMGARITVALRDAGYQVAVYDIAADAMERLTGPGIAPASSPGGVAAVAEVVLVSLPLPSHVDAVVGGPDGVLAGARPGSIVVDLSTVDPDTTRRLEARARQAGVGYLDAPVLGRPESCGRWTLPVGGDQRHLETARPALDTIARSVVNVGAPGAGNALKLLNNLMLGAINAVTAEIMAGCAAAGVDPATFSQTVSDSGAASVSNLFLEVAPKIVARDFSPQFTVDLLHKDNALAVAMLEQAGVPTIVGSTVQLLNSMARTTGHGAQDTSAVVQVYERLIAAEPGSPTDVDAAGRSRAEGRPGAV